MPERAVRGDGDPEVLDFLSMKIAADVGCLRTPFICHHAQIPASRGQCSEMCSGLRLWLAGSPRHRAGGIKLGVLETWTWGCEIVRHRKASSPG